MTTPRTTHHASHAGHQAPGTRLQAPRTLALLLLSATPLSAQQRDSVMLPAIIVTATRLPTPAAYVPNAVTVLRGDQLRARGVTRVVDALRVVPGLAVVQSGAPGAVASLFARGGESDHVRVLVDGVPVNQPGGSINLADLSTDNVDRIEIVRGPVSALFGSDAVTGVVQIFTRGGGAPGAGVAVRGGGAGADGEAWLRGRAGGLRYGAGASRVSSDGVYATNHTYRAWSASGMLQARPDARTDVQLAARLQDGVYHYPTDFAGFPSDSNQFTAGRLTTVSLDAGRALSGRTELRLLIGVTSGVDRAENRPDAPPDSEAYRNRTAYGRRSVDLRGNVRLTARTTLTAGAAIEEERFRNAIAFDGAFRSGDTVDVTRGNRALYAQLLSGVSSRVRLTTGVRLEDNQRFGRFATVRSGAAADLGRGTVLRLAAGTAFKEPTAYENFGGGFSTGNPDLSPERSRSAEAGLEQALSDGRVVLRATAFTQRFDSLIQYSFAVTPGEPNYRNIAGAGARGLELEGHARVGAGAVVTAQWTWLRTAVRDSGVDGSTFAVGRPLLRRPAQAGSLVVEQRLGARGLAAVTVRHTGRRDDLDYRNADPLTFAPLRVVLPAYTRIDLAGSWTLTAGGARAGLAVTGRIENVLDTRYEEVLYFPARGRTLWLGVRAGFGE